MRKILIMIFLVVSLFLIDYDVFAIRTLTVDNLEFSLNFVKDNEYSKNSNLTLNDVYTQLLDVYETQTNYDYYLIYATRSNDIYMYLFNENDVDNDLGFYVGSLNQFALRLSNKTSSVLYYFDSSNNIATTSIGSNFGWAGLGFLNDYFINDYTSTWSIPLLTNYDGFSLSFNTTNTIYDNIDISGNVITPGIDKILVEKDKGLFEYDFKTLDVWKLKEGDNTLIDSFEWEMIHYFKSGVAGGNVLKISNFDKDNILNYDIYRSPIYEKIPNWEYVDNYNLTSSLLSFSTVGTDVLVEWLELPFEWEKYQYKIRFNVSNLIPIEMLSLSDSIPLDNYSEKGCVYTYFINSLGFGEDMCYQNKGKVVPAVDFLVDLKRVVIPSNVRYYVLSSTNLLNEKILVSYVFPYDNVVYDYNLFNESIIGKSDVYNKYISHFDYFEYRKTFTKNSVWYVENMRYKTNNQSYDIYVTSDVDVHFIYDDIEVTIPIDDDVVIVNKPPINRDRVNEQPNVIDDNSNEHILSLFNSSFNYFVDSIKVIFSTITTFFNSLPLILKQYFIVIFMLLLLLYIFRFIL